MQKAKETKVLKEMVIGEPYKINTKKGVVTKYLSYIDTRTDMYYFVDKPKYVNSSKTGYMFGVRGTVYKIENVIR